MVEETANQGAVEAGQPTEEAAKQVRLNFSVDAGKYERLKELADYAANEVLIPSHHRGNITSFVNWCMEMGEEVLRQHALKKRGF